MKLVKMADVNDKRKDGLGELSSLTCHSLKYLACLVEILFQLDMSSRNDMRWDSVVESVRTSSISAVSSSMVETCRYRWSTLANDNFEIPSDGIIR